VRGLTYDYVLAFLAWDLTLMDLRKLVINSIEYASIDEEHKEEVRDFTVRKWVRFLEYVRGRL
jgi:adenosine deaminase CECR1